MPNIDEILNTAHWMFYGLTSQRVTRRAEFLFFESRTDYHKLPFHHPGFVDAQLPLTYSMQVVKWNWLKDLVLGDQRSGHYIFHHGLGGSSLLCRCLEMVSNTVVLKEASPLARVCRARPLTKEDGWTSWLNDLKTVHLLNSRPFSTGDVAIHKPQFVCNEIANVLLALDRRCRSVFLYQAPEHFLLTRLQSQSRRLAFWSEAQQILRRAQELSFKSELFNLREVPLSSFDKLDDSEALALFWLLNVLFILDVSGDVDAWGRLLCVSTSSLLDDPIVTVRSICGHFGISDASIDTAEGCWRVAISIDAKRPGEQYDQSQRRSRESATARAYMAEIEKGVRFLSSISNLSQIMSLLQGNGLHGDRLALRD